MVSSSSDAQREPVGVLGVVVAKPQAQVGVTSFLPGL
jgi:hypothetical protein